jgi:hypothetical protein
MTIGLLLVVIGSGYFSQTFAQFAEETTTLARLVVDLPAFTTLVGGMVFTCVVAMFLAFHFSPPFLLR